MGVVLAEVYYSAGWVAVPFVNMSSYDAAIGQYSHQQQAFEPARLARFGNTRLDVVLTPNATLRGKAWYDADQGCAFVAVVQAGGAATPLSFTATVLKAFNHRLVFGTVTATIRANEAKVLKVTTGPPPPPPPCAPHCAPPAPPALGVPPMKTDDLTVDAVGPSGAFTISTNGTPCFTHSPDDAWLKCAACVVRDPTGPTITGLAPLTLSAHRTWNGTDARGAFAAHEWTWQFTEAFPLDPFGCNPRRWVHTLWAYAGAVRFAQDLPEGVDQQSNCECGGKQACVAVGETVI